MSDLVRIHSAELLPFVPSEQRASLKVCLVGPPTVTDFNFEDPEVVETEAIRLIAEHAPIGVLSLCHSAGAGRAVAKRCGFEPVVLHLPSIGRPASGEGGGFLRVRDPGAGESSVRRYRIQLNLQQLSADYPHCPRNSKNSSGCAD